MKRSLHIILSLVLTFAVTDYMWVHLHGTGKSLVAVGADEGTEITEEDDLQPFPVFNLDTDYFSDNLVFHITTEPEVFTQSNFGHEGKVDRKLFLLFRQLKLHC